VEVNEAACHSLGYSRSRLLTMTAADALRVAFRKEDVVASADELDEIDEL
jgi:hypothetical protein